MDSVIFVVLVVLVVGVLCWCGNTLAVLAVKNHSKRGMFAVFALGNIAVGASVIMGVLVLSDWFDAEPHPQPIKETLND